MAATFIEDYDTSLFEINNKLAELKKLDKIPVHVWIELLAKNRTNPALFEYDMLGYQLLIAWLGVDRAGWLEGSASTNLVWYKANWYIRRLSELLNVSEFEVYRYFGD